MGTQETKELIMKIEQEVARQQLKNPNFPRVIVFSCEKEKIKEIKKNLRGKKCVACGKIKPINQFKTKNHKKCIKCAESRAKYKVRIEAGRKMKKCPMCDKDFKVTTKSPYCTKCRVLRNKGIKKEIIV